MFIIVVKVFVALFPFPISRSVIADLYLSRNTKWRRIKPIVPSTIVTF